MATKSLYKIVESIKSAGTYQLPSHTSTSYFDAFDWRFVYVEEGEAVYKFQGSSESVIRGDFFLLGPNERRISTTGKGPFKISVIYFEVHENISDDKMLNFKNRDGSYRLLLDMFKEIQIRKKEGFHVDMLNSMIHIFLRDYKELSGDSRIHKAISIVRQQNGWRLSADQLAKKVDLSRAHFNKLFKEQTSKPYALYCREYRMQLALTLMQEYGLNSKQVSLEIGSSSAQAFSREFKQFFGYPPGNFKNKSYFSYL